MKRAIWVALLSTFVLFAASCQSKTDTNDAIRDGIIKHISGMSGLNVNNMTVTVTKATINGDQAQANVDIRAKNGDPTVPAMQLTYELQKQGNEWVVLRGQSTGGMQHPTAGQMPPNGTLPPGHPSVGNATGQTPASHPDFNAILNSAQPPAQSQQQGSSQQSTQQPSSNRSKP
jgi:hypothetical protein